MVRRTNKLASRKVDTATTPGLLSDGGGLWLQITSSGSKSWVFRYTRNKIRRHHGLGSLLYVSLADARRKAHECRQLLAEGFDPIEESLKKKTVKHIETSMAKTFKECTQALITSKRSGWKNDKHAQQWESTLLTYAFPVIGDMPINKIDTSHVQACLEPIWTSKTETASRVRQRIEAVLAYAKTLGYRRGDNPASWKGHLENILPAPGKVTKKDKQPALPHQHVRAFLAEIHHPESSSSLALEFTILTAARTSQTILATWDEIDWQKKSWTIPADRMKAGKEHTVPLSPRAIEILEKARNISDGKFIFPGGRTNHPLSNAAMDQKLKGVNEARGKIGLSPWIDPKQNRNITVHGFRSSFRDWAGECTNFPSNVAEQALAHRLSDRVEAAYFRSDLYEKRKAMMDEWASYVGSSFST